MDINQIRELVRVAEESGVGEIRSRGRGRSYRCPHARRCCTRSCCPCCSRSSWQLLHPLLLLLQLLPQPLLILQIGIA